MAWQELRTALASRRSHPVESDPFVAEAVAELAGVVLQMADVVELELGFVEGQPPEAGWPFQVEDVYPGIDLGVEQVDVFKQLLLGVGLADLGLVVGRPGHDAQKLALVAMPGPLDEIVLGWLEVEVGVKEGVEGDPPEVVPGGGGPPQGLRADGDHLPEHVEGGMVLGFDDRLDVHGITYEVPSPSGHGTA